MRSAPAGWVHMVIAAAGLLTCAACGGGDRCGMGAMADTTGWQVVDAGPFVFKVPPGYRDQRMRGIDSYVGAWAQGERGISFDWGPYSSDPSVRRDPESPARTCGVRIAGRRVVLEENEWRDADGKALYGIRGWWRGGPESNDVVSGQTHLSFGGSVPAADRIGRREAMTIIRTVRIRARWTDADRLRQRHAACDRLRQESIDPVRDPYLAEELRRCPPGRPPPTDYERVR